MQRGLQKKKHKTLKNPKLLTRSTAKGKLKLWPYGSGIGIGIHPDVSIANFLRQRRSSRLDWNLPKGTFRMVQLKICTQEDTVSGSL